MVRRVCCVLPFSLPLCSVFFFKNIFGNAEIRNEMNDRSIVCCNVQRTMSAYDSLLVISQLPSIGLYSTLYNVCDFIFMWNYLLTSKCNILYAEKKQQNVPLQNFKLQQMTAPTIAKFLFLCIKRLYRV